jgi:hypothetical protein
LKAKATSTRGSNRPQPTGGQRLATPRLGRMGTFTAVAMPASLPALCLLAHPAAECWGLGPEACRRGSFLHSPHAWRGNRNTSLTTTPVGLILARSSKPCWHIGRLLKPTMVSPEVSPDGALGASPHGAGRGVSADSPKVTAFRVTRSAKLATMPGVYGGRFAAGTMGRPVAQRERSSRRLERDVQTRLIPKASA